MKIFYTLNNNRVIDINTEQVDESFLELEASDFDEVVSFFIEQGLQCDQENLDTIQSIYSEIDSSQESNINEDIYHIKHWVSNRSFGELIDMYENNEIKKPDMQRSFVWPSNKSSRLIESIIMGLPIPALFLLEVSDNEYEIIDGFQRLTTLFNYIKGYPWAGKREGGRPAKLSSGVMNAIAGKTFDQLSKEHQRALKRSTVPLIEFRQLTPGDYSSKYLIFERINTGSEKLNAMQIRKSLASGDFLRELYSFSERSEVFKSLFSPTQLKKDIHVEALLRFIVTKDMLENKFLPTKFGIKNILDEYCERNRNNSINERDIDEFYSKLEDLLKHFDNTEIFRKINIRKEFEGILNVSIMESFMSVIVSNNVDITPVLKNKYIEVLYSVIEKDYREGEKNPFTTSTGAEKSYTDRFKYCTEIISER